MYQVSVLVPVFGVEQYIERCARSLFEQTYANLEYIFVDDCSPDNSIAILKKVLEDYPARKEQVRIIRHERNRGLSAARNTAIDAATSPFVCHVDSDDYLSRDAIRLLMEKQEETGADIVSGNCYTITQKDIKKGSEIKYSNKHEMLLWVFSRKTGSLNVWGRIIRLSLYNDYQIRAKEGINNGEDWQQTPLLVYHANTVDRIDEYIYYYDCTNEHSYMNSVNRNPKIELWEQLVESIVIMENFFADKEPAYREASHRLAASGWKSILHLSAKHKVKDMFDQAKNTLLLNYTDCFDVIGWDNPLNRAFRCNYVLHSCYRRLYSYIMND